MRCVEPLNQVNGIRQHVDWWRDDDYLRIAAVPRQLVTHRQDLRTRQHPFYDCQLEAIEIGTTDDAHSS